MFSLWHHIALALSVSLSQLLIAPPAAFGQTTSTGTAAGVPSDSLAAASGDTLAAPGDSLSAPGDSLGAQGYTGSLAPPDTLDSIPRPGSDSVPAAGRADTARSPSDSVPAAATRDSARRPAAAVPAAPVDRILSAACGRPGGSASIAQGPVGRGLRTGSGSGRTCCRSRERGGQGAGPGGTGCLVHQVAGGRRRGRTQSRGGPAQSADGGTPGGIASLPARSTISQTLFAVRCTSNFSLPSTALPP